jgi:cytochrome c
MLRSTLLVAASLLPTLAIAQAPAAAAPPTAAEAEAGQRVFAQCRACHQVGETARNAVGPQLNGIFGRRAGSIEGFRYSQAYQSESVRSKVWDVDNFRVYIRNPREVTPGTNMAFAGIRNEDQITQLIAFLRSYNANGSRNLAP